MKSIFVILFCILGQLMFSQTIININPPQNISDDYQLVNISDTALIEIGHSDDMGKPYGHYYRIKSNVPNGEYHIYLYDVLELRAFIKNSQKDSVWIYYFSQGNPKSFTPYKNGLINGEETKYYFSGVVFSKCNYINNQPNGVAESYYESGKLLSRTYYNDGKYYIMEEYTEDGNLKNILTTQ